MFPTLEKKACGLNEPACLESNAGCRLDWQIFCSDSLNSNLLILRPWQLLTADKLNDIKTGYVATSCSRK